MLKETRAEAKRRVLYASILQQWHHIYTVAKTAKSLAAEEVARICDTSVTTVNRVVKENKPKRKLKKSA